MYLCVLFGLLPCTEEAPAGKEPQALQVVILGFVLHHNRIHPYFGIRDVVRPPCALCKDESVLLVAGKADVCLM